MSWKRIDIQNAWTVRLAGHRMTVIVVLEGGFCFHIDTIAEEEGGIARIPPSTVRGIVLLPRELFPILAAQGVEVTQQPKMHRDGSRSIYLRDPDNNLIQVLFHPHITGA
jgi:hypothetical protein